MTSGSTGELSTQLALLKEQNSKAFEAVSAIEAAGGARVDTEAPIAPDSPSIAETHAKIHALIGLVEGVVGASPDKVSLVPATHISGLPKELQRISEAFTSLLAHLDTVTKQHGGFGKIDASGFVIQSQNNQVPTNLADVYRNIGTHTDAALDRAHRILAIVSPDSYDAFAGAVADLATTLARLSDAQQAADENVKQIQAAAKAAADDAKKAAGSAGGAAASKQAADEALTQIKQHAEHTAKLLKDIEGACSQAQNLKTQVDAYQQNFTAFEAKLAERSKQFEAGKKALDDLIASRTAALDKLVKSLTEKDITANTIITNAKNALEWGTAEGLSSSFATSAMELDKPLRSTMRWFVASIVLLACWVFIVFILAPYLDPAFSMLNVPTGSDGLSVGAYLLGAVAVRMAVIAPAFILVLFFSRRYQVLFAARELYTFKKTVAASLPGFKHTAAAQDADAHVKAMTAAAFERLLFNPREQATSDLGGSPRGGLLSRWLAGLIKQAFEDSKRADTK
ncbi:hypothetical protein [uncultured Ferrovibrio sp.]|jgi:Membrane protein involved in colicin uptake|uniref:hypothetical protein n=1 Tax=uncultured Ferrovibrio sp. TaxID=1576913 RepID=UPI00260A2919|nr:hypothetical protein [uncultured Ferrovibrio sp.]